jgi:tetratricopeptide (TPR) repeat protein
LANESLSKKHLEAAKLFKMKSLPPDELKPPPEEKVEEEEDPKKKKGKEKEKDKKNIDVTEDNLEELSKRGNPRLHPEFKKPVLNNAQLDSIWFETALLFNRYNFYEISEKLLENTTEETKQTIEFKNEQAKVLLFRKDYEKVIELCNDIIKQKKLSYNTYIIKGHALYYLNRYKEAQETYIKAIRFKPQEINFDIEMLVKLGLIYIKEEKWYDAKVIFKQIIKYDQEASYAWRYLGYSLTQLAEFEEAEKALMKANILDVENPLIWAYLTIFDLNNGKKYQALECFNELNKVNYNDVKIMKQIAKLFYDLEEYEISKNIYLKIKDQEKTDGDCYLKIAKIFNEKLSQRQEALNILKEGLDKVMDDNYHQDIEKLIKDIEQEEQDLFIGELGEKDLENGEVSQTGKLLINES